MSAQSKIPRGARVGPRLSEPQHVDSPIRPGFSNALCLATLLRVGDPRSVREFDLECGDMSPLSPGGPVPQGAKLQDPTRLRWLDHPQRQT